MLGSLLQSGLDITNVGTVRFVSPMCSVTGLAAAVPTPFDQ
jgi:hypothetical protein